MNKNQSAKNGEVIFLAFLMLLGAYIFYRTFFLPPSFHQILGAAVYPRLIVALLAILCLMVLWRKIKAAPAAAPAKAGTAQAAGTKPPLLASSLLVAAYGLGFTFLGYFVSSFAFIVLLIFVLSGYSRKAIPRAVLISASVTAFMYLFLVCFLDLYFPATLLF